MLDIPALEEQKTVGLDNLGKLSYVPRSGKDRPANYRGLEQELPQYIIQALRYNGEINNDEMIANFISTEKKRSINSKVGTYLDQRGMIQALAILDYQETKYEQMVKRKTLIKCQQLHAETTEYERAAI